MGNYYTYYSLDSSEKPVERVVFHQPYTEVQNYRHVLYVIKKFCELGILTKEKGKGYIISDIEKLKQLQDK